MTPDRHGVPEEPAGSQRLLDEFQKFSRDALSAAHMAEPWVPFLQRLARLLLEFHECDAAGLWVLEGRDCHLCRAVRGPTVGLSHRVIPWPRIGEGPAGEPKNGLSALERLCRRVLDDGIDTSSDLRQQGGVFFNGNAPEPARPGPGPHEEVIEPESEAGKDSRSLLIAPFPLDRYGKGLVILESRRKGFFTAKAIPLLETSAQTIAMAAAHYRTQGALRERVKELGCLYDILKIVETPGISIDEILVRAANLLPPAWQYPPITHARIVLDSKRYGCSKFEASWQKQSAPVYVHGVPRGVVEVAYSRPMPDLQEGPFLQEERHLIESVAVQVGQVMERKKAEEDRQKLQDQLRHADRLATIGQLAAGVAHEFNEPLGNILGFAELVLKNEDLSDETRRDVQKITDASLYAREVIRKLMWFAREMPPRRDSVNLNEVFEEGLCLLGARCRKAGIEIVLALEPGLPEITADPAQLHQALMNLVVNAIHAMPEGGTVTIRSKSVDGEVRIAVEDTGVGMSPEVKSQIFLPFFTTKDVDEGTGLGLAVVHGIVTSHGGTVTVHSEVGRGSRFEIRLPAHTDPEGTARHD